MVDALNLSGTRLTGLHKKPMTKGACIANIDKVTPRHATHARTRTHALLRERVSRPRVSTHGVHRTGHRRRHAARRKVREHADGRGGGVCSYGRCGHGLYSYGLDSYGLYSYGLSSYGLSSYGLYSHDVCSYGLYTAMAYIGMAYMVMAT